jgi:hypothetical protein
MSRSLCWTIAQIADDLQIPEGTVKSRLRYALLALRLTLQEMGVTDDLRPGCRHFTPAETGVAPGPAGRRCGRTPRGPGDRW